MMPSFLLTHLLVVVLVPVGGLPLQHDEGMVLVLVAVQRVLAALCIDLDVYPQVLCLGQ